MISAIVARFGAWIVGIGGAVLGILAIFASAKRTGKAEGEKVAAETIAKDREVIAANNIKKNEAATQRQVEAIGNANDELAKVNRTSIDSVRDELRDNWTRD